MPEIPMFRSCDPIGRPHVGARASVMRFVDQVGLFLICPHRACQRSRRCADKAEDQLPFCAFQHRQTIRFLLAYVAARDGIPTGLRPLPDRTPEEEEQIRQEAIHDERTRPRVPAGETVLGTMKARGMPIERIARTREEGCDVWTWEREPWAVAMVQRARREHDAKAKRGAGRA